MSKAGKFELYVSDPYPCWVSVRYEGRELVRIHHKELSDLEYAVTKAMSEARIELKTYAHEV